MSENPNFKFELNYFKNNKEKINEALTKTIEHLNKLDHPSQIFEESSLGYPATFRSRSDGTQGPYAWRRCPGPLYPRPACACTHLRAICSVASWNVACVVCHEEGEKEEKEGRKEE